jgi:hypothetical protein
MYTTRAFYAGIVGAALMTLVLMLGRLAGLQANLAMMLGAMLTLRAGFDTWILGFFIHLLVGGGIGLVYAALFEYGFRRAGWARGLLIGAVHTVLSGLFLGAVPAVHPAVPEVLGAPGLFMANLGALGIVVFVLLHLMYGAVVGAIYRPANRHVREQPQEIYGGESAH